jgi:hypothetical protein
MRGLVQTIGSRLAAVAVAMSLSGVPRFLAPQEHPVHRCHCLARNGQHDCDCPLCHAEAARRGQSGAEDASLPPCHRALAAKARAAADESARRRADSGPCLTSTCGGAEGKLLPPPAVERFLPPQSHVQLVVEVVGDVTAVQPLPSSTQREPETPPPRVA